MADVFKLDDGRVEFQVNGDPKRTFYFYPSDAELINRIQTIISELEKEVNEIKNRKSETDMQIQDLLDLDSKIREKINEAFRYDVCDIVFGDLCLSTAAGRNHMPVFINFLSSVIELFSAEQQKVIAEVEKRTKKYTEKYAKQ